MQHIFVCLQAITRVPRIRQMAIHLAFVLHEPLSAAACQSWAYIFSPARHRKDTKCQQTEVLATCSPQPALLPVHVTEPQQAGYNKRFQDYWVGWSSALWMWGGAQGQVASLPWQGRRQSKVQSRSGEKGLEAATRLLHMAVAVSSGCLSLFFVHAACDA